MLLKNVFDKLVTIVSNFDTTGFNLKTEFDKHNKLNNRQIRLRKESQ